MNVSEIRELDEIQTEYHQACSRCAEVVDTGIDRIFQVHGETVCRYCVVECSVCGELIDDVRTNWGPAVTTDRRMDSHAVCVAEELLGMDAGEMDNATREEIEAACNLDIEGNRRILEIAR